LNIRLFFYFSNFSNLNMSSKGSGFELKSGPLAGPLVCRYSLKLRKFNIDDDDDDDDDALHAAIGEIKSRITLNKCRVHSTVGPISHRRR